MARYFKRFLPDWYKRHRNGQLFGALCALIGVLLIFLHYGWRLQGSLHAYLGLAVAIGLVAEVALGFVSNALWKEGKPPHWLHDKLHWYLGTPLHAVITLKSLCTMFTLHYVHSALHHTLNCITLLFILHTVQ